jgi:hypothetical protein
MFFGAVLQQLQTYAYVLRYVYLSVFPHVTGRGLQIGFFKKLSAGKSYENLSTFQFQWKYGSKIGKFCIEASVS